MCQSCFLQAFRGKWSSNDGNDDVLIIKIAVAFVEYFMGARWCAHLNNSVVGMNSVL